MKPFLRTLITGMLLTSSLVGRADKIHSKDGVTPPTSTEGRAKAGDADPEERRSASVRAQMPCPQSPLEACRWEQWVNHETREGQDVVHFEWEKSVLSRHVEHPRSAPIQCNVDRDFNYKGGGTLKVWFEGEKEPCDVNQHPRDPQTCGVKFLQDPAQPPRKPTEPPPSPYGMEVTSVKIDGKIKKVRKVELVSTIFVMCGSLTDPATTTRKCWKSTLSWDAESPGKAPNVRTRRWKPAHRKAFNPASEGFDKWSGKAVSKPMDPIHKQDLLKLAKERMPFGKYAGTRLIDLPEAYVVWFSKKGFPEGELGKMLRAVYEIKVNGLESLFEPGRI